MTPFASWQATSKTDSQPEIGDDGVDDDADCLKGATMKAGR